jgi:wyosine [tRNA(Phe)-imidazoG37] synthetase (radical SAM superfamily)
MSTRVLDFKNHSRSLEANRYVYAVVSRRARGLSVGVNLNPDKVCNFDCPYCQVDRATPGGAAAIDVAALVAELEAQLRQAATPEFWTLPPFDTVAPELRRVADVAFAGDGEPTTPPEFPAVAAAVRDLLARRGLTIPVRLITNATMFDRERVKNALGCFDELWCKLDAGTESYFQLVDGTRLPFAKILANLTALARLRPIVIQSLFMRFAGAPPSPEEIDAYVARLREIDVAGGTIDRVQVYTVARKPTDPRCEPLPIETLDAIAERVRELGLSAETFA